MITEFPEHVLALARVASLNVTVNEVEASVLGDWLEENGEHDLARAIRDHRRGWRREVFVRYYQALAWILFPEPVPYVAIAGRYADGFAAVP